MSHYKLNHVYVGVDLHKEAHTAVVMNCWNEILGEMKFENKPSAFPDFLIKVNELIDKGLIPIFGLEDVGGYGRSLAVFLLENNQQVREVNTALSAAERKSNPMVKKNDSWDAECVARVLLTKLESLPLANPQDIYWTIAQLVSRRTGIIKAQITLKNQLHAQLSHHYPSYKKFFSEIDGKCALIFWHTYPSPQILKGTTIEELTTFLRKASNNACSTRKAEEILRLVDQDGDTTRSFQDQRDFLIQSFVRDLCFKCEEMQSIEAELKILMDQLDYKLETMPGIDLVTAAYLVAEIGDVTRFANADKLAKFAGVAPVYFGSGGKGKDKKNEQGNRILHGLFYTLAIQQVQVSKGNRIPRNPLFYEYYHRKQAEGKSKRQALVCVMRRLVTIIYSMMKNKTAFVLPEVKTIEKQAG